MKAAVLPSPSAADSSFIEELISHFFLLFLCLSSLFVTVIASLLTSLKLQPGIMKL